jgi:hypothetical protein
MAKYKDKPLEAEAIARFLNERDDFAFEMRVMRSIVEADPGGIELHVDFGGSYADPVTGKSRQYDIRASARKENKKLRIAIECKQLSQAFPLVVSRCPRPRAEAYHNLIVAKAREPIHEVEDRPAYHTSRVFYGASAYAGEAPVGKGSTQLGIHANTGEFISDDSDIYEKWAQALASAEDLIWAGIHDWDTYGKGNKNLLFLSAVLPILVVPDGALWILDYDDEGTLTGPPSQAKATEFYVGKLVRKAEPMVRFEITHLHIFTHSGFKEFLESSFVQGGVWSRFFASESQMGEISWHD